MTPHSPHSQALELKTGPHLDLTPVVSLSQFVVVVVVFILVRILVKRKNNIIDMNNNNICVYRYEKQYI